MAAAKSLASESPQAETPRAARPLLAMLALVFLGVSAFYLVMRIPIGIPGEWVTSYHTIFPDAGQMALLAFVLIAFVALAYVLDLAAARLGRSIRAAAAVVLTAAYGYVLLAVVVCGPLGRGELVVPAFAFDACGLFKNEADKITGAGSYLGAFPDTLTAYAADYRKTVRVNNNPPGTTMLFYGCNKIAAASPALARLASRAVFGPGFAPPSVSFSATVLGAWCILIGTALAFLPAYLITSKLAGRPSYLATAAAMLAGSLVLFNPGNDNMQVTFFLWMVYFFLRRRQGRAALWGLAFGALAAGAFFFTLATAVVVIVLFAWNAAEWYVEGRARTRRDVVFWLGAAVGLLAGFTALRAFLGYNSFAALLACYRNHGAFYSHFPRTYWKWLIYNPWEFVLFTGGPLAAAIFWAALRKPGADELAALPNVRLARAALAATLLVMLVLNVSGKNSSEVNRLWVFFMPLLTIPACVIVSAGAKRRVTILAIAVLQALNILILRSYVDTWRTENLMNDLQKYMGQ